MNNSIENIISKFNNSILKIDWFANIGKFSTNNNLIYINNYLSSIDETAKTILVATWKEASFLIKSESYDKNLLEKEEQEKKTLYANIIKNFSEDELSKNLSVITQTSYKIVNSALIEVAKKNNINDQYFFKVAGGAAGLACNQKALALIGKAKKTHMFNTKFKIYSLGNWPLVIKKNKISIF